MKHLAHITICVALFSGCTSSAIHSKLSDAKLYAVAADDAAFFRYGPQQGNGPDRTLPRNTLVRMIRPSWGYSKVQLVDDNQQGYIASEDIRVAPSSLVAAATATPPPSATAEQFDLNSTDPQINAAAETLPSPDLPPAADLPASPAPSPADQ